VLSLDYLASRFTPVEWAAVFRRDPTGEQGIVLPIRVRVRPCEVEGLLGQIGYIDLLDYSEQEALAMLLAHVHCNTIFGLLSKSKVGNWLIVCTVTKLNH
jgi:hypothetical protein